MDMMIPLYSLPGWANNSDFSVVLPEPRPGPQTQRFLFQCVTLNAESMVSGLWGVQQVGCSHKIRLSNMLILFTHTLPTMPCYDKGDGNLKSLDISLSGNGWAGNTGFLWGILSVENTSGTGSTSVHHKVLQLAGQEDGPAGNSKRPLRVVACGQLWQVGTCELNNSARNSIVTGARVTQWPVLKSSCQRYHAEAWGVVPFQHGSDSFCIGHPKWLVSFWSGVSHGSKSSPIWHIALGCRISMTGIFTGTWGAQLNSNTLKIPQVRDFWEHLIVSLNSSTHWSMDLCVCVCGLVLGSLQCSKFHPHKKSRLI